VRVELLGFGKIMNDLDTRQARRDFLAAASFFR
jgi:hypothetical protein